MSTMQNAFAALPADVLDTALGKRVFKSLERRVAWQAKRKQMKQRQARGSKR